MGTFKRVAPRQNKGAQVTGVQTFRGSKMTGSCACAQQHENAVTVLSHCCMHPCQSNCLERHSGTVEKPLHRVTHSLLPMRDPPVQRPDLYCFLGSSESVGGSIRYLHTMATHIRSHESCELTQPRQELCAHVPPVAKRVCCTTALDSRSERRDYPTRCQEACFAATHLNSCSTVFFSLKLHHRHGRAKVTENPHAMHACMPVAAA